MSTQTVTSLDRALPFLRFGGAAPTAVSGGAALRCPASGRDIPVRDGVLDLLGDAFQPTTSQRLLDNAPSAWLYERVRPHLGPLLGMPSFDAEVSNLLTRLGVAAGDTVLDIACGQGNFTGELARAVGPDGLVIGVDIAGAMLHRAASHLRKRGLSNVLLIRADALDLPIADGCLQRVNCSGGIHQFPDLRRALAEMGRVSAPGARLAVSGFATATDAEKGAFRRWVERSDSDFVAMDRLTDEFQRAGFENVQSEFGGWVGYQWATRSGAAAPTR